MGNTGLGINQQENKHPCQCHMCLFNFLIQDYSLYSDRALCLTYIALSSEYMDCSETLSFVRFPIIVAKNSFIHSKSKYSLQKVSLHSLAVRVMKFYSCKVTNQSVIQRMLIWHHPHIEMSRGSVTLHFSFCQLKPQVNHKHEDTEVEDIVQNKQHCLMLAPFLSTNTNGVAYLLRENLDKAIPSLCM